MATTLQAAEQDHAPPMWMLVATWALVLPMIFFAVDGLFTFDPGLARTQSGTFQNTLLVTRNNSDRIVRVGIAMLFFPSIFYFLVQNYERVLRTCSEERLLLIIPIWAIVSVAWSQSPQNTIYYGLNLLVLTLFAFYMARAFDPDQLMRFFILCGFVFMVLNALTAIFLPFYGTSHSMTGGVPELQGICIHKNACAYTTVFLIAPALFVQLQGNLAEFRRLGYIALGLVEVILTQSRTGWVLAILLLGFSAIYLTLNKFKTRDAAALVLFFTTIIGFVGFGIYQNYEQILLLMGKEATLSGRTQIWGAVLISIWKHPLVGYGFHGFWTGLSGESSNIALRVHWNPGFAHSGYLETWLEVGGVGLALILWTFIRAMRDAATVLSHTRGTYLGFYLSILFLTVVVNIDESTLLGASSLTWMFYLLACIGLRSEAREVLIERYQAGIAQ